jgi:hypothetical protein
MSIQSENVKVSMPGCKSAVRPGLRHQRGVALFFGMVLMIMLTVIALVVMRNTMLELRLTTATAQHELAFQSSEEARQIPEAILVAHVRNRGWPVSWGGTVADAMFNLNTVYAGRTTWINLLNPKTTSGKGIQDSCSGTGLVIFYMAQPCTTETVSYNYTPSSWTSSVSFNVCENGTTSCSSSGQVADAVSIVRDGTTINQGSGAAQAQGYSSVGVGSSTGGSSLLLEVGSTATLPSGAKDTTIAQYKLGISN